MQLWSVFVIASNLVLSVEVDASVVPPHFAQTIRCPFKKVWLEHGPERAAEILGVVPHRRLSTVFGSCTYTNTFAGVDSCMEFHGDSWTDEKAKSACDDPMSMEGGPKGTLAKGSCCSLSSDFAGWCGTKKDGDSIMTAMDGDCKASKDGCADWSQGDWVDGDKCKASTMGSTSTAPSPTPAASNVFGSCTYTNTFAGVDSCMEFHGDSWTDEKAKSACDNPMSMEGGPKGTLAKGSGCSLSSDFAGWCGTKKDGDSIMTAMDGDCKASKDGCADWSQGDWVDGDKCKSGTAPGPTPHTYQSDQSAKPQERCSIAPGPIGAAHQHGQSPGYSNDCEGTPAQKSPYMWPLRWTAHLEGQSFEFESDEPTYESKGQVWYMLDKNWKRLDTWYTKGVLRAIGQEPCSDEAKTGDFGCAAQTVNTTMLHRGNKMVFIDWDAQVGSRITNCTWMNLDVIGNIRPDWFMDDRGAATDVQYIGDSHVYHMGKPRLVKQWRKKDFANQYFTMSVQRLPGEDGVHWPLILNIPGEGFGDDSLQHWSSHRVLTEAHESEFLLDAQYETEGGTCTQLGSAGGGPPTGLVDHVPSNLEKEEASWRKIVYTASPVWNPPATAESTCERPGFVQVTAEVQAEYCYDPGSSLLRLTMNMDMATPAWAAVGFMQTEECLMTPRGGADGEVVYAHQDTAGNYMLSHGSLSPSLKRFSDAAVQDFESSLKTFDGTGDFDASFVDYQNGKLTFGFARKYATKPVKAHFNFAIGLAAKMSYHDKRECFEVANVPTCPTFARAPVTSATGTPNGKVTTTEPPEEEGSAFQTSDSRTSAIVHGLALVFSTMWMING